MAQSELLFAAPDMVGECSEQINKNDITTTLSHPSFRDMFLSGHRPFLTFLSHQIVPITNLAFGVSTPEIEATEELTKVALFCLTTPSPVFSSQLASSRGFLRTLNDFISADSVTRDVATRFCMIFEFLVEASNGFVLVHFPQRLKLIEKLARNLKFMAVQELFLFLTLFGERALFNFLQESDAAAVLLSHLGQSEVVDCRIFICLSQMLSGASRDSKLTEKFRERETIDKLLQYCLHSKENLSVAAFRLVTSFCNHLYDNGGDTTLVTQLTEHVSDLCEFIKSGNHFTKSRSLAVIVLTRVMIFTCGDLPSEVINLLQWMFQRFTEEKHQTFFHSAFYELFKVSMVKNVSIVQKLHVKETIMELYSKREEDIANYWGFLHRITALVVRWRGLDDYVVPGWNEFVKRQFSRDEHLYLCPYGGAVPEGGANLISLEDTIGGSSFPSLNDDECKSVKRILSQPTFNKVTALQTRKVGTKSSSDGEEDTEYDYEDFDSEALPPEVQGTMVKWLFQQLIRTERIKTKVRLELLNVFPQDTTVNSIIFSPDDSRIALISGEKVEVFTMGAIETLLFDRTFPAPIKAATFVNNNRMAFVVEDSPVLTFIDIRSHEIETCALMVVHSAAFSRDGARLSCVHDSETVIYDVATMNELRRINRDDQFACCAQFSPNGEWIAVSYDHKTVDVHGVETGEQKLSIEMTGGDPHAILVNDTGAMLITGGEESTLTMWEAAKGALEWRTLRGHKAEVGFLAMDREQRWMVSGGKDAHIHISSLITKEMIYSVSAHTSAISAIQFASNGLLFASTSDERLVKVWKINESVG